MPEHKGYLRNDNGNVLTMFGLVLAPLVASMAIGIDYTRAATARTHMQTAIDAAALTVAREAGGLHGGQLTNRARQVFDANYRAAQWAAVTHFSAVKNGDKIVIEAKGRVKAHLLPAIGKGDIDIGSKAESSWGSNKIELALVLDNTGSMGVNGKMPALRQASHALLNILEGVVNNPGDVKISIVPFDTHVKIGASFKNASWLRYAPADTASNGATLANWTGCVTDRDQPFDTDDTWPNPGNLQTRYLASNCPNTALATLRPLTSDFNALRATVNTMQPSGCTNVTIGAQWGLSTLSPDAPMTEGAAFGAPSTLKIMLILTDGWNTRNRFVNSTGCGGGGNPAAIDTRTQLACAAVKAKGVRVYTVRVIEGSAALLQQCAGNGGNYYDVQNVNQLTPVFQEIANQIKAIRLTS